MKAIIEFYRTRPQDDAHAVVGREVVDVVDLNDAVKLAWSMAHTLDMPQHPDFLAISDADGRTLYSRPIPLPPTAENGYPQ
ncbi:hypothetical protein [Nitrospirillum viridazoti]|uniref:Uncharacterized protein n=1 Tax=Nitrospirillum viridazoti CBAmc TaxID=1441467 RepID=A0A248JNH8_9PROT|nr:hypothetical protein [Nitrospirillum amazonense]ASG20292.1 hypothetical protein Y958_05265 [Nitrospirillum amazonense CBAmc]TWB27944.1 hypothetical protein FBZ91_1311 [Nitrospirillum amazonense]